MVILIVFIPHTFASSGLTVDRDDQSAISKIKTAYLYNFLKYIELQQSEQQLAQDAFTVCVLGDDPFGQSLDALNEFTAKGMPVKVLRLTNVDDAKVCHIVYISETERNDLQNILKALSQESLLTVGDSDGFLESGGIIKFLNDENKISIKINLSNARRADIRISALLLEIAKLTE